MREIVLNPPTLAFIAGTRGALGVGIGLLLAERIPADRRRVIGGALIAIGAATTIPAARTVFRSMRRRGVSRPESIDRDEAFVGATRYARKGDDDY